MYCILKIVNQKHINTKKQGRIEKNCKYYNDEKCTCILSYKSFCINRIKERWIMNEKKRIRKESDREADKRYNAKRINFKKKTLIKKL